jgi:MFS family permease
MTSGRLTGDRIVQRFGTTRIIGYGGLCAAVGFAIATLVPSWPAAVLGFALVGVGCANIVPVLFTSVGRQTVMPENLAVPAMTALGYAGVLTGPAAIGFVAQATSLSVAFLTVAVMLIGVAASGRLLRK